MRGPEEKKLRHTEEETTTRTTLGWVTQNGWFSSDARLDGNKRAGQSLRVFLGTSEYSAADGSLLLDNAPVA